MLAKGAMFRPGRDLSPAAARRSAELVPPVERADRFVFEFGDVAFEIDAARGGRITRACLGATELLTGPEVEPLNYGSTFWPSPQSGWRWPPPVEIDSEPYAAVLRGAVLELQGPASPALGLAVTKTFSAEAARGLVTIEYCLSNRGSTATRVAPWEITRVFPGGLTFYPTGGAPYGGELPLPRTLAAGGATWLPYDADGVTTHQKLFADGSGGFLAHAAGSALLVKAFEDIAPEQAAPGEGEIEIYFDGQRRYVEIEQQGAYVELAPGASSTWVVRWYLRAIPETVAIAPGSAGLLALARDVAAS